MNTNMTGFRVFKNLWVLVLWTKVASALGGFTSLKNNCISHALRDDADFVSELNLLTSLGIILTRDNYIDFCMVERFYLTQPLSTSLHIQGGRGLAQSQPAHNQKNRISEYAAYSNNLMTRHARHSTTRLAKPPYDATTAFAAG